MKLGLTTLTLMLLIIGTIGCRKKNTAGLGGDNELRLRVRHHTIILDSITVYLKFNAQDAPTSTDDYDISTKVTNVDGEKLAVFEGLKDGDYYIYGYGWDPFIVDNVEGGLPLELSDETNPIQYDLQVTEAGH